MKEEAEVGWASVAGGGGLPSEEGPRRVVSLKGGGSILMDAPPCSSFDELVVLASDRESWWLSVHALI